MSELTNMDKRTKRLLAILGIVVAIAFYMTVIKGSGEETSPAPEPSKSAQSSKEDKQSPDGLPADPTKAERPGVSEGGQGVQTPAKYPGTAPVVVVYNPFRPAGQ